MPLPALPPRRRGLCKVGQDVSDHHPLQSHLPRYPHLPSTSGRDASRPQQQDEQASAAAHFIIPRRTRRNRMLM